MYKSIITDQISMDFEEALKTAKRQDYNSIEIHSLWGKTVEDLTGQEVLKVRELLKTYDMKVSCLSSTIFFMCPLYDYYALDSFNQKFLTLNGGLEKHLEGLKRAAEISQKLEAPFIRIFPFRFPSNKKDVCEDDLKLVTENINTAVRIAENLDVVLVLENCPHSHMPKGIMTKKVIDNINSTNLKLLWDSGNSYRAPIDILSDKYAQVSPYDELDLILPAIKHVHLKDYKYVNNGDASTYNHITFGEGSMDYEKILKKLYISKYNNAVSLESEVNYEDTMQSMTNLKKLQNKIESEE